MKINFTNAELNKDITNVINANSGAGINADVKAGAGTGTGVRTTARTTANIHGIEYSDKYSNAKSGVKADVNIARFLGFGAKTTGKNGYVKNDYSKNEYVKNGNRLDSNSLNFGKSGKSLTELQIEAGAIDLGVSRDYQILLSNTLSAEDYEKAKSKGFDFAAMNSGDAVTIQDKVKAEVAKSGNVISGYNDNLSSDVLKEAFGSETLARSIESEFSKANLPLTDENIEEIGRAWDMLKNLNAPSEADIAYMIENEMDPSVWNIYLAENSGSEKASFYTDIYADIYTDTDVEEYFSMPENVGLEKQVKNILTKSGLDNASSMTEGMKDAIWLLQRNLPVTNDTIVRLRNIKAIDFPVSEDKFASAAAASLTYGDTPVYSDLSKSESVYQIANNVYDKYFSADMWNMTAADITSRRQLEEVRLSMTAEVNVKLISSGFAIDTAPMEELIDALKKTEIQIAAKYFGEYSDSSEEAVKNYRLMNETEKIVDETAKLPASTLGVFYGRNAYDITLKEFHAEGLSRRDVYIKAEESYEALMTAPRADLGDSIKKAFSNIPDILNAAGIEASKENQRAARILGYNHMEITAENIETIVSADNKVQSIINNMTPASVLRMIRDGINPLESSFDALDKYFEDYKAAGFYDEVRDYSNYLYNLEMTDSITPAERDSFIGIYRMLHQIDKSNGAAVGAVINEKAVLDFNNLISAVRSNRFGGLDIRVDDNLGGTSDIIRAAKSITEQIKTAYIGARTSLEMAELRDAANIGSEVTAMLEKYEIEDSANNMLAMEELISGQSNLFEEIAGYGRESKTVVKNITEKIENSMDTENFDEAVAESDTELENIAKNAVFNATEYVDVKSLALINRQFGIMGKINTATASAGEKDYIVPFEIGDEVSKVHLAFRNGFGSSSIDINVFLQDSTIEAHLQVIGERIEGYLVGNDEATLKKLNSISDIFIEALNTDSNLGKYKIGDLPVMEKSADELISKADNFLSKDAEVHNSEGTERKILLQMSKVFLQSVRNI